MRRPLLAVLAIVAYACSAGTSTAAADGVADWAFWRNYQCYETSGGHQPASDDRLLTDRFGSRVVDIDEPETFCAGAEVLRSDSDEDPYLGSDGGDFACYDVDGGQRPNALVLVDVIVPSHFIGPDSPTAGTPSALTVEHAKSLCVPTSSGRVPPTTVLDESAAEYLDQDDFHNLYYQCYGVAGGRQPSDDLRFVQDWIGPGTRNVDPPRRVDVDQPVRLCVLANRDGRERVNPEGAAYLCYDIDGGQTAGFEHFFYNGLTVPQLDHVALEQAERLCLPAKVQHA